MVASLDMFHSKDSSFDWDFTYLILFEALLWSLVLISGILMINNMLRVIYLQLFKIMNLILFYRNN